MGKNPFLTSLLLSALVFATAAVVYSQYGFQGKLVRDNAIYVYSGQQMAKGVPPYVSIFDHKGPLAPMISGVGVIMATFFNFDDLFTVRLIFFIFGCLTVVGIYLLGYTLFESHWTGILAAFVFIGFWGFGRHAASGPQAKIPMTFFEVLAILLTVRKRWFWAGFFGSLSFLTWQPMAVYPVVTLLLAVIQAKGRQERIRNTVHAVSGILMPIIIVSLYFLYKGAFFELVDGAIFFNILHLDRGYFYPLNDITRPIKAIYNGYTLMFAPLIIGLLMVSILYVRRMGLHGRNIYSLLSNDPFAVVLLSFPAPVIWSIFDFQGYVDFFVFLPYAAIGFAMFLYMFLDYVSGIKHVGHTLSMACFIFVCTILIVSAAINYRLTSEKGLERQRLWANQVRAHLGEGGKLLSIGRPSILSLLHMTNQNRYVFITFGIDNHIDANTPGGFKGWLKGLEEYNPSIIALGYTMGRFKGELMRWLHTHYRETNVGEWSIFVKKDT